MYTRPASSVCNLTPRLQVQPGKKGPEKGGTVEGVEVTLNPEELDLDTAAMQAKYEETVREQQSQLEKEDLSDMVAAHAAKQRVSGGCCSTRCISCALRHVLGVPVNGNRNVQKTTTSKQEYACSQ